MKFEPGNTVEFIRAPTIREREQAPGAYFPEVRACGLVLDKFSASETYYLVHVHDRKAWYPESMLELV